MVRRHTVYPQPCVSWTLTFGLRPADLEGGGVKGLWHTRLLGFVLSLPQVSPDEPLHQLPSSLHPKHNSPLWCTEPEEPCNIPEVNSLLFEEKNTERGIILLTSTCRLSVFQIWSVTKGSGWERFLLQQAWNQQMSEQMWVYDSTSAICCAAIGLQCNHLLYLSSSLCLLCCFMSWINGLYKCLLLV